MAIKYLAGERLIGTAAERTALTYTGSPPQTSWKELDRVTLSGTSDTMDTGTFTAKDNLMFLVHIIRSGSVSVDMTFNADTGSNYAGRLSETGESAEILEKSKNTQNIEVGFNVKYLIDALSSFESSEVFVSINDEVSPACIFSDETDQEKQKAIIMPMRV